MKKGQWRRTSWSNNAMRATWLSRLWGSEILLTRSFAVVTFLYWSRNSWTMALRSSAKAEDVAEVFIGIVREVLTWRGRKEWGSGKNLAIFNPMQHTLGPVMSLPRAASPKHEVHHAQHRGLKEVGEPRSSPCSSATEETEDSLGLSWEEMMHVTWIYPL